MPNILSLRDKKVPFPKKICSGSYVINEQGFFFSNVVILKYLANFSPKNREFSFALETKKSDKICAHKNH
jgi:hypothetical protein